MQPCPASNSSTKNHPKGLVPPHDGQCLPPLDLRAKVARIYHLDPLQSDLDSAPLSKKSAYGCCGRLHIQEGQYHPRAPLKSELAYHQLSINQASVHGCLDVSQMGNYRAAKLLEIV